MSHKGAIPQQWGCISSLIDLIVLQKGIEADFLILNLGGSYPSYPPPPCDSYMVHMCHSIDLIVLQKGIEADSLL